jgi:hypothetical protein
MELLAVRELLYGWWPLGAAQHDCGRTALSLRAYL